MTRFMERRLRIRVYIYICYGSFIFVRLNWFREPRWIFNFEPKQGLINAKVECFGDRSWILSKYWTWSDGFRRLTEEYYITVFFLNIINITNVFKSHTVLSPHCFNTPLRAALLENSAKCKDVYLAQKRAHTFLHSRDILQLRSAVPRIQ